MNKPLTAIAKQIFHRIALPLCCLALFSLIACGSPSTLGQANRDTGTISQLAPNAALAITAYNPQTFSLQTSSLQTSVDKLKFKRDDGSKAFSLEFKTDGAKLVNGSDQELARLKLNQNQKVKIKGPDATVLGYVISTGDDWSIANAQQTQKLFILHRQDGGGYKLEDGNEQQLYRIKARGYGFEIETPGKQSLYKVKVKGDKTSLRNASGKTVLSTKSPIAAIAMASFGLDQLSPEQQAALAFAVNRTGAPQEN